MSLLKECVSGYKHEGTPDGTIQTIGGIECYVATPTVDYPKDKVVILLTDVFGLGLVNNKLLSDDFAKNGFKTITPDLFQGDPIPAAGMSDPSFNREAWFGKHMGGGFAVADGYARSVITALQAEGVTKFGAVGYCFGARIAADLALENLLVAASLTHPSRIAVPGDLEKLKETKTAIQLNIAEIDKSFGAPELKIADGILGGGQHAPGYATSFWEGCEHGFAVRGDLNNPQVKAGKEGAFKATAEFFFTYL